MMMVSCSAPLDSTIKDSSANSNTSSNLNSETDNTSKPNTDKTDVESDVVSSDSYETENVTSDKTTSNDIASNNSEWQINSYYASKLDLSLTGAALKTNLFKIISPHTNLGYDGLWTAYKTTDLRDDGTIWDMYSNQRFKFGAKQCGSYSKEGDCYNREHTIPQSVFNKKAPMVSDVFHIYPTDGKINGIRSNYPHAEIGSVKNTKDNPSSNGSALGTSNTPGYSGIAFEPIDEYKGDFARTYFYFVTCYQDKLSSFKDFAAFSKNTYPSLSSWAKTLYLKWSKEDPVSQKEIDRNEAAYKLQKNRNPFIDFPGIENKIW